MNFPQKLPIGLSTLKKIRQNNYAYVDKTQLICQLIDSGSYYFLSRPRRFGKSLLVDTIKELFSANKALFNGLYAENHWDWSKSYPIINMSFSDGVVKNAEQLRIKIDEILLNQAELHDVQLTFNSISGRFQQLIKNTHDKCQQPVVVLIDEYDKPILDRINESDVACELREELKNFYSVIKGQDAYLQFVFVTGVSKFSKVSIFSGLNNLKDISLDKRYSALCGYTQDDLETVFASYLVDADKEKVKQWYNGYQWLGESVYNPFDVLLFIDNDLEYRNYWFETGTPSFLIQLIKARSYFIPDLEQIEGDDDLLGSFDVESVQLEVILFQAGYLTIKEIKKIGVRRIYVLGYPNLEVQHALNNHILDYLTQQQTQKTLHQQAIYSVLENQELEQLEQVLSQLFSSIPYNNFVNNKIYQYEGYYASVIYSYFASLGIPLIAEDVTNKGRIDLTLKLNKNVFIFEFKMIKNATEKNTAMRQLKQQKYANKYVSMNCYLIAIEFDSEVKNIINYQWEKA
jgi:hypothetical protein